MAGSAKVISFRKEIASRIQAMRRIVLLCALSLPLLSGCLEGYLPDPVQEAKKAEADAAATGASCRQAGRSIEECFERHENLSRSSALKGWQEMDEYMRKNKLDPQPLSKEKEDRRAALKDAAKEEPAPADTAKH